MKFRKVYIDASVFTEEEAVGMICGELTVRSKFEKGDIFRFEFEPFLKFSNESIPTVYVESVRNAKFIDDVPALLLSDYVFGTRKDAEEFIDSISEIDGMDGDIYER